MEVIESGEPKMNIEEPLVLPDGTRWLKTDKLPIKDENGDVTGIIGFSVDITERKRAEEALRESEERYRLLAENASDVIWVADMDMKYQYVSPSVERIRGYKPEELIGLSMGEFLMPSSTELVRVEYEKEMELERRGQIGPHKTRAFEVEAKRKDGSIIWVEAIVGPMRDENGDLTGILGITRDITERRRAEEALRQSEEKLRLMFESMTDGVVVSDVNVNIVDINPAVLHTSGYSREDLIGRNVIEILPSKDRDRAFDNISEISSSSGKFGKNEYRFLRADDTELDIEVSTAVLRDSSGGVMGYIHTVKDITENKRIHEALKRSEERYRLLFDSAIDGKVVIDAETMKVVLVNRTSLTTHGFDSEDDLSAINLFDYIHPDDRDRAMKNMAEDMFEKDLRRLEEFRTITKDGEEKWLLAMGIPIEYEGRMAGLSSFIDVTERKRMEEELRRSEEKYRDLVQREKDIIFSVDELGFIATINPAVSAWGFTPEEIIGKNFLELISDEWQEKTAVDLQNALLVAGDLTAETMVINKDGIAMPIEYSAMVIHEEGKYTGAQGIVRDISERKKAEEALRVSEEKLRVMFESITDGISIIDLATGKVADANPAAMRIFGFKKEDVVGMDAFSLIAEKDRTRATEDIQNTLRHGQGGLEGWCLLNAKGEEMDCEATAAVIHDRSGEPAFLVNVIRDITERKRIEKELSEYRTDLERIVQERTSELVEANKELQWEIVERQKAEVELKESEEKYRALVDDMREGYLVIGENKILFANKRCTDVVGLTPEKLIGKDFWSFISPQDKVQAKHIFEVLESGEEPARLWDFVHPAEEDGKDILLEVSIRRISYDGQPAFAVVLRDVTERKRMEEALRESESKSRAILDAMPDLVFQLSKEGILLDYKGPLEDIYLSPGEFIGRNISEVIPDEVNELSKRNIALALETGQTHSYGYQLMLRDEIHHCDARVAPMNEEEVIVIIRDITERVHMEEALRESEEKLRVMFASMADGVVVTDMEGNIKDLNEAQLRLFGYSRREDVIGENGFQFVAMKCRDAAVADMAVLFEGSYQTGKIWTFVDRDGREFDAELSSALIRDADGKPTGITVVLRDVTERRFMELALKASEEKLRGIFESIQDSVVLTDLEFTITEVNEAAVRLSGYKTREELLGRKGYDFLAPEDLTRAMDTEDEAVKGRPLPRDEYKIVNMEGREIDGDVGVSMFHDTEGNAVGFVTVIKDITERRRMEDALRDSEEKLRIMFTSMADGVVVTNLEGRVVDINEAQLRMFGYKDKREVIGKGGFDFVAEWDRERAFEDMIKVFGEGYNIGGTYTVVDKAGREFESELSTALLHDALGKPGGFITVMRDVTERRKMERLLRDSEEKLRIIFESIGDGIVVTDLEGIIIELNEAAARMGGWPDKLQLIGMSGFDFVAEKERGKLVADMVKALGEESSIKADYVVKDKDGCEYDSEAIVTLLRDAAQSPVGIVTVIRDITERKRMEQALRDSEEMARGMLESAATAVCIVQDGKFRYVSPMFAKMTGYTSYELLGTKSVDYIYEEDREKSTREAVADLKGESAAPHEYRLMRKDGSIMWILEKVASIQYEGKRAAIGSLLDISKLKQVEEALRDSEEKLRIIFASIPDGVTVTDLLGNIIDENGACVRLYGYSSKEDVIGLNGFDFIAEVDRETALSKLSDIFETEVSPPIEFRMVKRDG
ncbi:MAG: PAS domain S-box protein, partial [Chloroflexota bacterium]|nr:PAS domain S-box protein [Chloroflexota bacterium]